MPGWNPAYTAWMVLAVLVSWGLGRRSRRLVPLSRGERWVIAAAAFSGSMLAARSPYAVAQFAGLLGVAFPQTFHDPEDGRQEGVERSGDRILGVA